METRHSDRRTRGARGGRGNTRRFRDLYRRLQERRSVRTETIELKTYRFWHLDYGEVAYYDQLVFKRHEPIPAERAPAPRLSSDSDTVR